MIMILLIKKRKKIITVMINANNSSSDFSFGHFVEVEDIPQSCIAKLLFTNLNNGLCEVVLNFICY